MAQFELDLAKEGLTAERYEQGKKLGYPDQTLLRLSGAAELPTEAKHAVYKMVDTCGAEFDAETPYFYSTFDRFCESRTFPRSGKPVIMVLGSGPIRIGQGIEFDYSSVHCVWTLKELGYEVVIVNNNPETVSTDYDTADRLYFEPLFPEDVMHIIEVEKPVGVVVAFGGQTAIKLTQYLDSHGIPILGTSAESIDMAEDRERFDELLERFHIKRPQGRGVLGMEEALNAAHELGYPVLLRPSYVIGGQNMVIAHNDEDVRTYMEVILSGKIENPVLVDQYLMGKELEVDVISDGTDVLIPGVMQHIERTGVHSGDSIAVYPPFSIGDKMLKVIVDCSEKLALSLGTKGLINIQYLIYQGELYVIEVNPRASRTVPYISKVTGVPMVDLATRVMVGQSLKSLGYGTGLYRQPPYVAVKVPVFSFEKITDANAALSPEMKSTGEVLGLGKNLQEAMFKGLVSAGYKVEKAERGGVLISVNHRDQPEIVGIARALDEMGFKLYATEGTAHEISQLGTDVEVVGKLGKDNRVFQMLEEGKIDYVILTGSTEPSYIRDFIHLNHRCVQLGIPCLTSLDTAAALTDILASRYTQQNTELIDICHLRSERQKLRFSKMQTCGNDYIFLENFHGEITCPESLCVTFCDRHYGIGADGIVLMEYSQKADARMRMFNSDGSEGMMAGNALRCMAKYLYDNGIVRKEEMTIETGKGVKHVQVYTTNGKVTSACVDMGYATLDTAALRFTIPEKTVVNYPVRIGGRPYNITCVDVGNPHCVVFCPRVDAVDVDFIGPRFEHAPYFQERINTEFIRVVNPNTIKMRVWERGSGETLACGTGACAAVVAAVANGLCSKGSDITVRVRGGDLVVNYTDEKVTLTGDAKRVYPGVAEYYDVWPALLSHGAPAFCEETGYERKTGISALGVLCRGGAAGAERGTAGRLYVFVPGRRVCQCPDRQHGSAGHSGRGRKVAGGGAVSDPHSGLCRRRDGGGNGKAAAPQCRRLSLAAYGAGAGNCAAGRSGLCAAGHLGQRGECGGVLCLCAAGGGIPQGPWTRLCIHHVHRQSAQRHGGAVSLRLRTGAGQPAHGRMLLCRHCLLPLRCGTGRRAAARFGPVDGAGGRCGTGRGVCVDVDSIKSKKFEKVKDKLQNIQKKI